MKQRRALLLCMAVVLVACAAPAASAPVATAPGTQSQTAAPTGDAQVDPLLTVELVDVRSGMSFTLGELAADGPVLLETMAIWCSNCRAQQREVVAAHALTNFHSVGIDVDPNERPEDLVAYAEREGFDWAYAMAQSELVRPLTDRFGFGVTNPPSTPTFIITSDGKVRALEFGRHRSAAELVAELTAG